MRPIALVVEDDDDIRQTIRDLLESDGFDTLGVPTVAGALAKLAVPGISVMILDLALLDGTGEEVLVTMRAQGTAVPVVIVSASPLGGELARRHNVPFVAKPFDVEVLLAAVAVAIDRRSTPVP